MDIYMHPKKQNKRAEGFSIYLVIQKDSFASDEIS